MRRFLSGSRYSTQQSEYVSVRCQLQWCGYASGSIASFNNLCRRCLGRSAWGLDAIYRVAAQSGCNATQPRRFAALLLHVVSLTLFAAGGSAAMAQSTPTGAAQPPASNVQMPLVSPEQAAAFFATRSAAPSDAPPLSSRPPADPIQPLPIEPVLGHPLPTDATTASGMARADFAIAKPDKVKGNGVASGTDGPASSPSTTVIREVPPLIGKQ
ncbi:hypothetical protein V1294_006804 [Bradyrhizobium sp. AZCC 1678]|uniref:hypothetical protein n=1 Tax=Bradyrhizobium sp. AZCC 1678 TaxID=3117030 RepID=UPI002FF2FDD6